VLSKALKDGTDAHDERAEHDRPSSPVLLVEPWGNRHSEDGPKLVARRNEPQNTGLNVGLAFCVDIAVAEVLVERSGELEGVNELRVESGGDLNAHTDDEEVNVHAPQVGLLVPWHLVLLDHARNDRVGAMTDVWCLEDAHDGVGEAQ